MWDIFYVDHARLTRRDKAMIKTHAGDETEASVTGAMMELSSEFEGGRPDSPSASRRVSWEERKVKSI